MALCKCGCGKATPLATRNRPSIGLVKGQPIRWLRGHKRWPQGDRVCKRCGDVSVIEGRLLCLPCSNAAQREWRAEHPEYVRKTTATQRAQYKANRAAARKADEARRDRENAAVRAWRVANPEKARAGAQRYRRENPETVARCDRAKRAARPDYYAALKAADVARRRARLSAATYTEYVDRIVVLERADGVCGICDQDVDVHEYHVDHIVPLSRGGDHSYANTQPTHPSCNLRKSNRLQEELCTLPPIG